jgi:hypothetical protein
MENGGVQEELDRPGPAVPAALLKVPSCFKLRM